MHDKQNGSDYISKMVEEQARIARNLNIIKTTTECIDDSEKVHLVVVINPVPYSINQCLSFDVKSSSYYRIMDILKKELE